MGSPSPCWFWCCLDFPNPGHTQAFREVLVSRVRGDFMAVPLDFSQISFYPHLRASQQPLS